MTDDDPHRQIRCQDALQAAFQDLVSTAISVGWSKHEVLLVIGNLVDLPVLSRGVNNPTDALVALLKRMT